MQEFIIQLHFKNLSISEACNYVYTNKREEQDCLDKNNFYE